MANAQPAEEPRERNTSALCWILAGILLFILLLGGCNRILDGFGRWDGGNTGQMVYAPDSGSIWVAEEPAVCRFADGYTAEGRVVPSGTIVYGPAVVKPNRDTNDAVIVLVGGSYTTKASDEVIWLLVGDNACARSQSAFFGSTREIAP
jgi:hypothetical protein